MIYHIIQLFRILNVPTPSHHPCDLPANVPNLPPTIPAHSLAINKKFHIICSNIKTDGIIKNPNNKSIYDNCLFHSDTTNIIVWGSAVLISEPNCALSPLCYCFGSLNSVFYVTSPSALLWSYDADSSVIFEGIQEQVLEQMCGLSVW